MKPVWFPPASKYPLRLFLSLLQVSWCLPVEESQSLMSRLLGEYAKGTANCGRSRLLVWSSGCKEPCRKRVDFSPGRDGPESD